MSPKKDEIDEKFMLMAIEEALKGLGRTSPNPCVGAVVTKHGVVIGRGYHHKAGTPHAEIHALNDVDQESEGATIYVTLEPCSHTGRTPPCCRALVQAGISKVVVGMTDPNPLVNGRGIKYLRDHGVEVKIGVLSEQCERINYPFIKKVTTGLPWMIMKAGVSLDGRLNYQKGQSGWITGSESSTAVHKLRDNVDAIMVGANTIKIDNPSLTTRLKAQGGRKSKDPIRIIVDSTLTVPLGSKVFNLASKAPTWIICSENVSKSKIAAIEDLGALVFPVQSSPQGIALEAALRRLANADVSSILVEGGAALHGSLLGAGLYDYAHLFYGPIFAGDAGVPLLSCLNVPGRETAIKLGSRVVESCGEDIHISGRFKYPQATT